MNSKSLIQMLTIGITTVGLTAFYVLNEHANRDFPNIEKVKNMTSLINKEITKANQREDLPELSATWQSITSIASVYGVKVSALDEAKAAGMTEADIPGGTPWYGVLQGKTKNVAIAAMNIQRAVPIIYGAAALDNDLTGLSFAALGSTNTSN